MSNVKSAFAIDSQVLQAGGIASFRKSSNIFATSDIFESILYFISLNLVVNSFVFGLLVIFSTFY